MEVDADLVMSHYYYLAPLFNGMVLSDIGIVLFDKERCLLYYPGKLMDLGIKPGDPVKPDSGAHIAMRENRRVVAKMEKELYGRDFFVVATPICDQKGEVIGAIAVQEPTDKQEELANMAANLNESISVLASTMEEVSAQAQEISAASHTVFSAAQELKDQLSQTNKVLDLIKTIASQTNLLGLNAAIEAARVGQYGRGFGVVAEEIRKLAANSSESVHQIKAITSNIQGSSEKSVAEIGHIETGIDQITQAVTYAADAIQKTSEMAFRLSTVADSLLESAARNS